MISSSNAQWRSSRFVHLGPQDGLASWTFDLAQDSVGLIYLATDQGLVRYDGHEFKLFAHESGRPGSIGPGDIWSVLQGTDGLLWMGSRVSGLNVFNPQNETFKIIPLPTSRTKHQSIYSIAEDALGNIWIGANNKRLIKLDRLKIAFEEYFPDDYLTQAEIPGPITDILTDQFDHNVIWFAMPWPKEQPNDYYAALVKFRIREKKFEVLPVRGKPKFQDKNGAIWLVNNGVSSYIPTSKQVRSFPLHRIEEGQVFPVNVRDVLLYNHRILVAAPYRLLELNSDGTYTELWSDQGLGIVEKLYIDKQNNLWVGRDKGISILNPREQAIDFYSFAGLGLPGRIYPGRLAFDESHNSILVSGYTTRKLGQQLIHLPLDKSKKPTLINFPATVYGVAMNTQGETYLAVGNTLRQYPNGILDSSNFRIVRKDMPTLWHMSYSPEGYLTGIGSSSFTWLDPKTSQWQTLTQDSVPSLNGFKDFQGSSYLGNHQILLYSSKIFQINLQNKDVTELTIHGPVNYPGSEAINSVLKDESGTYWISTLNVTGAFLRSRDSLILSRNYSIADGLNSAWAHELFEDQKHRIWFFASNGMSSLNPITREIKYFGVKEGLHDHYFDPRQIISLPSGHLATVNGPGVILFHPDSLWLYFDHRDISIFIKSIRINGNSLILPKHPNFIKDIVLTPSQKYLDVQFQALTYPSDYRETYSYQIEEIHPDWIFNEQNKIITLSNLSSGTYQLKIKAGGISSISPEKKLTIKVLAPLIQRPWFVLIIFSAISLLLYGWHLWRIDGIHQRLLEKNEFNRKVAELELKALRAQMNPHFMFNSLNSIKNYILQAQPQIAAAYLSDFAHLIRLILQYSREKTITLNEELQALDLYIQLEQLRLDQGFHYHCRVAENIPVHSIRIPPLLLQPYVENAIWHGLMPKKSPGHLILEFYREENYVVCKIDDDGVGRQESLKAHNVNPRYKSMGMGITKERIDILNSLSAFGIAITIEDKYDQNNIPSGTTVFLKIPQEYI